MLSYLKIIIMIQRIGFYYASNIFNTGEDCQTHISGGMNIHCTGCKINGAGKCDPNHCPQSTVYNNNTRTCENCQIAIGGYKEFNCFSCNKNGAGKCDYGECPRLIRFDSNGKKTVGFGGDYKYKSYDASIKQCVVCQENIGEHSGLNCESCSNNGLGKCDEDGCPNNQVNGGMKRYTSYNDTVEKCNICQENIGEQKGLNCKSCASTGERKCDPGSCPTDGKVHVAYNNNTTLCMLCQTNIGWKIGLNCKDCTENGDGHCDPGSCPQSSFYQTSTKTCQPCQMNIAGHEGLNCISCDGNGLRNCDIDGCPYGITYYNADEMECLETDPVQYECFENQEMDNSDDHFVIQDDDLTLYACLSLCVQTTDLICRSINFVIRGSGWLQEIPKCYMFAYDRYTKNVKKLIEPHYTAKHCTVGLCVIGEGFVHTENERQCRVCPENTYNNDAGTMCRACMQGYDTDGRTGATQCQKLCAAGHENIDNHLECSACPPDTYKKEYGSSNCVPCPSQTTTDGKSGATSCQANSNVMANSLIYWTGAISGILALIGGLLGALKLVKMKITSVKEKSTVLKLISTTINPGVPDVNLEYKEQPKNEHANNVCPCLDSCHNISSDVGIGVDRFDQALYESTITNLDPACHSTTSSGIQKLKEKMPFIKAALIMKSVLEEQKRLEFISIDQIDTEKETKPPENEPENMAEVQIDILQIHCDAAQRQKEAAECQKQAMQEFMKMINEGRELIASLKKH